MGDRRAPGASASLPSSRVLQTEQRPGDQSSRGDEMHLPARRTLPRMPRKTPSEQRFERYLEAQGHAFEFEPDLGTHFKPDYKVLLPAIDVVVEVKEFKTNWLTERLSPIGAADAGRPTR